MERIDLDLPPLGVKVLCDSISGFEGFPVYRGISYCDAARLATYGESMLVVDGSIETCKWCPAVLGLKKAETDFERSLLPRPREPVAGYFLSQLAGFVDGRKPDVVIIRGTAAQLKWLVGAVGTDSFATRYVGQIGKTALGAMDGPRSLLARVVNRLVSRLRRWKRFEDLTRTVFRSHAVSSGFDKLIKYTMADMSMCRNSTVIPYLEGKANVSFFCVGGITWGRNEPYNLTCGLPYGLFESIRDKLTYPRKKWGQV